MVNCAVEKCRNDSKKTKSKLLSNISYHRFPKNEEKRNLWIKVINRPNWEPNVLSRICSDHFDTELYYQTIKGLRKLQANAVPSKGLPSDFQESTICAEVKQYDDTSFNLFDTTQQLELKNKVKHMTELAESRHKQMKSVSKSRRNLNKKLTSITELLEQTIQKHSLENEKSQSLKRLDTTVEGSLQRTIESKTEMFSVAYITVPDMDVGKKIAIGLVTKKLAACVNIIPGVTSIYEWKGKINEDSELLLMVKTRTSKVKEVTDFVRSNHPYEVCEVISLPISDGNPPYLKWIEDTVSEKNIKMEDAVLEKNIKIEDTVPENC